MPAANAVPSISQHLDTWNIVFGPFVSRGMLLILKSPVTYLTLNECEGRGLAGNGEPPQISITIENIPNQL